MSTLGYAVRDTRTMLRRNLLHARRYPTMTFMVISIPVIFLLLFVYVLGNTLGAGLGGGRTAYADYVTPGIMLMGIASSAQGTSISIAMDMAEGIVARFRTMAIFRPSVLTGHVIGSMIQTVVGVTVLTGIALLVGFRPDATPVEWLATIGMLLLTSYAITWLSVACGLVSKSVEAASNLPMPLLLLPFLGSGFVPTATMPVVLRWFAEYQPYTPIMNTLRGLLLGTGIGRDGVLAIGWCVVIAVASYLWARKLYNRER
jgi:ABC-2 type transport system permease protein